MVNFIELGGAVLTTKGNQWDINTNVPPVLVAAIAYSNVLDETNTFPPSGPGTKLWTTSVPNHIVFSEVETYLQTNSQTKGYSVTIPGKRFEW